MWDTQYFKKPVILDLLCIIVHARRSYWDNDVEVDTATRSRSVAMEVTKKSVTPSVGELFKSMEYGPAPGKVKFLIDKFYHKDHTILFSFN